MSTAKPITKTTDATDAVIKPSIEEIAVEVVKNLDDAARKRNETIVKQVISQAKDAPAEKSMWGTVKGFFTSPTMCTFGMLGASMLAGAVGGIAATEARQRGYLGGAGPAHTPMLPPPNNG